MSHNKQELSALVDGELDTSVSARLLDQLQTDEELRASWERLHLIGHIIRGEPVHAHYREVADRVRERLSREPTVLAPSAVKPERPRSWAMPMLSTALAASLALVAVFALPPLFEQPSVPGSTLARPSKPAAELYVRGPDNHWNLDKPAVESKLNRYLVNHQKYAPTSRLKGLLPYATFVSYDPGR